MRAGAVGAQVDARASLLMAERRSAAHECALAAAEDAAAVASRASLRAAVERDRTGGWASCEVERADGAFVVPEVRVHPRVPLSA